mmetsp:Transcript_13407/g.18365  ORF Transcript_13407/g.18365 Transcript_13407/m.18365 type:complete len:306 (+) Transcript_13407:51-968(+)
MENTSSSNAALITLNPPHVLTFNLEKDASPKTVLKVTNTSNSKVLFKVKTTQPAWYYVRPNQQMLEIGQSEDVVILLVDQECNRCLEQAASNSEEKLDKHRFLVLSTTLSDDDFARILELTPTQRLDEFAKVWEGAADVRKNIKLKVEFNYRNISENDSLLPSASTVRKAIARAPESTTAVPTSNEDTSKANLNSSNKINNPEVILSELQTLRKKYDAVVEYTVHLTTERDSIFAQLESAQRELIKEKAKKKSSASSSSTSDSTPSTVTEKKKASEKSGFSLPIVILAALLSFLIGKFLSSSVAV